MFGQFVSDHSRNRKRSRMEIENKFQFNLIKILVRQWSVQFTAFFVAILSKEEIMVKMKVYSDPRSPCLLNFP